LSSINVDSPNSYSGNRIVEGRQRGRSKKMTKGKGRKWRPASIYESPQTRAGLPAEDLDFTVQLTSTGLYAQSITVVPNQGKRDEVAQERGSKVHGEEGTRCVRS
jgi:hypothetical protein